MKLRRAFPDPLDKFRYLLVGEQLFNRVIIASQLRFREHRVKLRVAGVVEKFGGSVATAFQDGSEMVPAAVPGRDFATTERTDRIRGTIVHQSR